MSKRLHTICQIKETLANRDDIESRAAYTALGFKKSILLDDQSDLLIFDLCEHNTCYSSIYNHISYVLQKFRLMSLDLSGLRGLNKQRGLSIEILGKVLDRIGEPWPNEFIVRAIQLQLLKIENRFYPATDIVNMTFSNLDVRQNELLFHC